MGCTWLVSNVPRAFAEAGIHDFLVSIHGIGETVRDDPRPWPRQRRPAARGARTISATLGIPFRFNVTMIRDNLTELEAIAALAGSKGARVVNFLTFNPYFEWERDIDDRASRPATPRSPPT